MLKSVSCYGKRHERCSGEECECYCHHENSCNCFACRIRTVSFGEVPGGYKSSN